MHNKPFSPQHVACFRQKVSNAAISNYRSAQAHRPGLVQVLIFNVKIEHKDISLLYMKSDVVGLLIPIRDTKELAQELQQCPQRNKVSGELKYRVMLFSVCKPAVLDALPTGTVRSDPSANAWLPLHRYKFLKSHVNSISGQGNLIVG
jgi:hypothetical protein